MVARNVSITAVARSLSEYLNRVVYRRERFVLHRGGKPVAELRPVARGVRLGDLPALMSGLPHLSPTEASDFARDLEKSRAGHRRETLRNPWAS